MEYIKVVEINNNIFVIKPKIKYLNVFYPKVFVYFNIWGEKIEKDKWNLLNDIKLTSQLYDIIQGLYTIKEDVKQTIRKLISMYFQNHIPIFESQNEVKIWNTINQYGVLVNENGLVRISYLELIELTPLEFEILVEFQRQAIEHINKKIRDIRK